MEFGGGDCPSVAGEFGACSVQDCKNVLCFDDVGAVAGDDWMEVAEDAVSVTRDEAKETAIKDGLEKAGDGELRGFHSGFARHV